LEGERAQRVVSKRQVVALPQPKRAVTEHQMGDIEGCGCVQQGADPPAIRASVPSGAGGRVLVTNLSGAHNMPLAQLCCLVADCYGDEVKSEPVETALAAGDEVARPLEARSVEPLQQAEVVHCDDTGWRLEGTLQWVYPASNAWDTHFCVHAKRGEAALCSEASGLNAGRGYAVPDGLAASCKCREGRHGLWNAHRVRAVHGWIEPGSQWATAMHTFLLDR
jgi:transposase